MSAKEIITTQIGDWGNERALYPVSKEEFETLLTELSVKPSKLNDPNGDGTYFSEIEVDGKFFCHSGRDKISGRTL